ncbi:MAG: HAD hydrolase family protein [Candidatus Obscuribacterales bacterium]|nr:HAD hydrolase family protein [Candidatus Obscuribacterales bacterium]
MTSNYSTEQLSRAKNIKLLLMDVDGVMTDGKLYYFPDAQGKMVEFKGFNSHDGLGLYLCNAAGIITGVISGRNSPAVEERAKILKMRYVHQGHLDKVKTWEETLADAGVDAEEAAFIGDDFPDIPLMRRAGLAVAVANARPEVKAAAHFVSEHNGGEGAVRDAAELILKAKGVWDTVSAHYFQIPVPSHD